MENSVRQKLPGAHRLSVSVRWGHSTWNAAESFPTVNADEALEGESTVIPPLHTIRSLSLDMTTIATDNVYRQYQHVQFPEYQWNSSATTIAVRRSYYTPRSFFRLHLTVAPEGSVRQTRLGGRHRQTPYEANARHTKIQCRLPEYLPPRYMRDPLEPRTSRTHLRRP